jgi:hypothetical protein
MTPNEIIYLCAFTALACLCISPCYFYCRNYRNQLSLTNATQNPIYQEPTNASYEI